MAKELNNKAISKSKKDAFGGRVTSYDVARHANVSQSAVSRCFQPGGHVSKAMRDRINKAIKELGYQPNAFARSLITRRSNLIAVIVANLTAYPELLVNLSKSLSEKGLNMLLFSLDDNRNLDHIFEQVRQYRVDGVISAADLPSEQITVLTDASIPVVFINHRYSGLPVNSVYCDQVAGERTLVDQLVTAGYKSFGIIAGPQRSVVSAQRTTGAIDRLNELGYTDFVVVSGNYDYESGSDALPKLVEEMGNKMPEAILCANDFMAFGCIDRARNDYKLNVPDDLAVVGYDGASQAYWDNYRLVTIHQPIEDMAEAAIAIILERIKEPEMPVETRMFKGALQKGQSAKVVNT